MADLWDTTDSHVPRSGGRQLLVLKVGSERLECFLVVSASVSPTPLPPLRVGDFALLHFPAVRRCSLFIDAGPDVKEGGGRGAVF